MPPRENSGKYLLRLTWLFFLAAAPFSANVVLAEAPFAVCVSIPPQKYFVEKIGKTRVAVSVMVAPGANPANYEPKPRQMLALANTRIYFAIGVPFEDAWLHKIASANPAMQIVRTQAGIEKSVMKRYFHESNERDANRENGNGGDAVRRSAAGIRDPHIWLSPPLVMLQARHILRTLTSLDSQHRSMYESNYKSFINELVDLDAELSAIFTQNAENRQFMVFHPAWGYFAKAYRLNQIAVEIEGKQPKAVDLRHLIAYARGRGIGVIFAQPQFSTRSAEIVAGAISAQIVFADPLAANWATNLRRTAAGFKAALQ